MLEEIVKYLTDNKEWIFSGIGPWLIGGIVTVILAIARILYTQRKRKGLSVIRIEKNLEATVIEIDAETEPNIKDKLKITYEDQPVEGIYELIFTVHNLSQRPIEDVTLLFCFETLSDVDFIEIELTNEERRAEYTVTPSKFVQNAEAQILEQSPEQEPMLELMILDQNEAVLELGYNGNPNVLALHLPYLNPWEKYEDYLGVTMFTPKRLIVEDIVGKGVGWRTKYIDRTGYHRTLMKALVKMAFVSSYSIEKIRRFVHWR